VTLARILLLVGIAATPFAASAEQDLMLGRPIQAVPVNALQGLAPLAQAELGVLRGGTSTAPTPVRPGVPSVQFWDEMARPRPPAPPQDGVVSSTSRGMR
jgi:hypothetical protein